ncbi:MAG: glycosyltransferase [Syntrophaceae bacterium]
MTDPLVSINMITYNHAPFIAQSIDGVLHQKTNFPFELVIGEDCSTDATRKIVLEYQIKYPDIIRVIISSENVGMKKNFRRTQKACRGTYMAYCEGDDYWHHPDKLQKQVDYMECHPECGMVFSDCDIYHNKSMEIRRSVRYSDGYQSLEKFGIEQIVGYEKIGRWPWTCTAMVRRDLCEQVVENDPYLHQSEKFLLGDLQVWAELALISEVIYMPESLATYRINDVSVTNNIDLKKNLLFGISISELRMYLCDKHKLSENIRRQSESVWCDKSLQLAFIDKNAKLALEVKKKQLRFTWQEWFRYFGAKYLVIHYGFRAAVLFRNLFRKQLDPLET